MLSCTFENIETIYSTCKALTIPLYQREYSWDHSHISELLCDIFNAFKQSRNDDYFLGTIVLVGELNASLDMEIVDGQQRLTSIALILQALSMQHAGVCGKFKDFMWDKNENHQRFLKLQTQKPSQQVYYDHFLAPILGNPCNYVEGSDPILKNLNKRLFENLSIILELFKGFKIWDADSNTFLKVQGDHFESIYKFILKQCKLVRVICREKTNALRIFGTLNSKGMPLNDFDLIKFEAFKDLNERNMPPLVRVWDGIFAKNDSDKEAHRLLSIFFNYHFDYQQRLPKHDWLKSISQIFIPDYFKEKNEMKDRLNHLLKLKNWYISLKQNSGSIVGRRSCHKFEISQRLLLLNLLPQPYQDQWITLVLKFMDCYEGSKKWDSWLLKFLKYITQYFSFIFLLSQTHQTNGEKKLYNDSNTKIGMIMTLMKTKGLPIEAFWKQLANSAFTSKEKECFASNLSRPVYGKNPNSKKLCKFLLLVLEFDEIKVSNGVQYTSENLSVEHVQAQSNLRDWSETDRQLHIHRLGNCTILSKPDNSSHGADAYIKKKEGYKKNVFQLTREISHEHTEWTVQNFKIRHYQLMEKFGVVFDISNEMKKIIEREKEVEADMNGTINASALLLGKNNFNSQISTYREQFKESLPILKALQIDPEWKPREKFDIQDSGYSKNRFNSLKTVLESALMRRLKSEDFRKTLSEILTANGANMDEDKLVIVSDKIVQEILTKVASTYDIIFRYRSLSGESSTIPSSADSVDGYHMCIAQTFHGFIEFELSNLTYNTNQEGFLKANGFRKHAIVGDGNCQFAAIADQLKRLGLDVNHENLRTRAVDFLIKEANEVCIEAGETLRDFIDAATGSFNNYIQKMRQIGEWGDHFTLQVLAQIFQVKINVISPTAVPPIMSISPWSQESERIIHDVFLLFQMNHYDSLSVSTEPEPSGPNLEGNKVNTKRKHREGEQGAQSNQSKRLKLNQCSEAIGKSACNEMVDSTNFSYACGKCHKFDSKMNTRCMKATKHVYCDEHMQNTKNIQERSEQNSIQNGGVQISKKLKFYSEDDLNNMGKARLQEKCKYREIKYNEDSDKDILMNLIMEWQKSHGQVPGDNANQNSNAEKSPGETINFKKLKSYTEEELNDMDLSKLKEKCRARKIKYNEKSEKTSLVKEIIKWQNSHSRHNRPGDNSGTQPHMQDVAHLQTDKVSYSNQNDNNMEISRAHEEPSHKNIHFGGKTFKIYKKNELSRMEAAALQELCQLYDIKCNESSDLAVPTLVEAILKAQFDIEQAYDLILNQLG